MRACGLKIENFEMPSKVLKRRQIGNLRIGVCLGGVYPQVPVGQRPQLLSPEVGLLVENSPHCVEPSDFNIDLVLSDH